MGHARVANAHGEGEAPGTANEPNDWATEHDDPIYILDLEGRVVTGSMPTLEIVDSLPPMEL